MLDVLIDLVAVCIVIGAAVVIAYHLARWLDVL